MRLGRVIIKNFPNFKSLDMKLQRRVSSELSLAVGGGLSGCSAQLLVSLKMKRMLSGGT